MPVGGLRHRFTTSSRGNAYAVPRSTEFCCWFGNSKVVNADDTPKLVYHGTVNDFRGLRRNEETTARVWICALAPEVPSFPSHASPRHRNAARKRRRCAGHARAGERRLASTESRTRRRMAVL